MDYCSQLRWEMPRHRLLDYITSQGYSSILLAGRLKTRRLVRDPFQELAVDLLVRGGRLEDNQGLRGRLVYIEEYRGHYYSLGFPRGERSLDAVYEPRGVYGEEWSIIAGSSTPLVVIDTSMASWHRHGSELSSLRRQLGSVLGVVRQYLWDAHLALTSAAPGLREWLKSFMASKWVRYTSLHAEEYLRLQGIEPREIIALDPSSEQALKPQEMLRAKAFIIGGIVDKIPWRGLTQKLLELAAPSAQRRKLVLRGSSVGVPHRLNIVVEIILAARYRYCGDTEKAIIASMTRRDRRMRLHRELLRATRGGRLPATRSLFLELSQWLPITWSDYVAVARSIGARIEDRE